MTSRLDAVLQKYPEHEEGIRLLASRDPSSNLKYLDWGAKTLASGQALAPEIADVIELFHRFAGQPVHVAERPRARRRRGRRVQRDIYVYRPQDLAKLRDTLFKMKRARDRKRKERERLYKIEGAIEADIVYDSDDLVVRHIKNKAASAHHGLNTKWCISMLREGYFDDYDSQNATFFFFERKRPLGDEFDKVCLMLPRGGRHGYAETYTSLDMRVDMMELAKVFGSRIFDIFREIYERSERHPASAVFKVYRGEATEAELEAVFASLNKKTAPYMAANLLVSICCNDEAPWALLEKITARGLKMIQSPADRRAHRRKKTFEREVRAALAIHPKTPPEVRKTLITSLRRGRVDVDSIRRGDDGGVIRPLFETPFRRFANRRRRRRYMDRSPSELVRLAGMLERRALRARKKAATLAAKKKRRP